MGKESQAFTAFHTIFTLEEDHHAAVVTVETFHTLDFLRLPKRFAQKAADLTLLPGEGIF
jgi:hypothetical protein